MTALQKRQSDQAVLGGQEFFRLFQKLESAGDIFEINTGTKAMSVGPQSDLANYSVNFFDAQSSDSIDEVNVSVDNPMIGRLDALLATKYPTASGLPARILIKPRDNIDLNYLPSTFSVHGGPVQSDFVAARPIPRIDIFSYLSDPPTLAPLRDDRLFSFPFATTLTSPTTAFYILPYYGRRFAHFNFQNLYGASAITYTIDILGVNILPGKQNSDGLVPGNSKAIETPLGGGSIVVPQGGNSSKVITAATDGMFDMLSIGITVDIGVADVNSVMQILTSDRVG